MPDCGAMKDDFIATLKSARDLAMALLKHKENVVVLAHSLNLA